MEGKISHSGLLARSPEGHAARGMQIKGNEDVWVEIQANTFRNWVNEHLPKDLRIVDLSEVLFSIIWCQWYCHQLVAGSITVKRKLCLIALS